MKIAIASDIHLEFGTIELNNTDNAKVLILAGDITVATYLDKSQTHLSAGDRKIGDLTINFFKDVCSKFEHVIYVAGNHEHYKGDFTKTIQTLRTFLKFPNLHILDCESIEIEDKIFFGGTMWTNCNDLDPITVMRLRSSMSDFSVIKNSSHMAHKWITTPKYENGVPIRDSEGNVVNERKSHKYIPKLSPNDTIDEFDKFIKSLESAAFNNRDRDLVVVSHHSPTRQSTHPLYLKDIYINGGYSSNLDSFIIDNPNIKLWACGHTHYRFDLNIGNTRVVLNPRGYYRYEPQVNTFNLLFLDI